MKDLSIVISSCNKYHYLWDIQLQLFNKFWPQCPYEIYVISESSELPQMDTNLKLNNYNTNKQPTGPSDWSPALRDALSKIDSKYILYLQEDYIFTDFVDESRFEALLQYAMENELNYIRFYTGPPGNGNVVQIQEDVRIREILPGSRWRNNLMLALWKKETLTSMLKQHPAITPWQFEHLSSDQYEKFYCIDIPTNDSSDILPFLGMYGSTNGFTFYPVIVDFLQHQDIKKLDGSDIDFNIVL